MRSVIATEVIPNIMHARRGGRVLSQLGANASANMTTTPMPNGSVRFRASDRVPRVVTVPGLPQTRTCSH